MPGDRRPAAGQDWPRLAMDAWWLGAEASHVIWLRWGRLAQGGALAHREANRMVAEKWKANVDLAMALATGSFGSEARGIAQGTVSHYRKRVRANRTRLTR